MNVRLPRALAVLALCAAALATGCSDDDVLTPPAEDPIGPGSPQEAVEALAQAWSEMDIDALGGLLHPDYRFLFSPDSDFAPTTLWDRERELAAGAHLFSGAAGRDFEGTVRPGVAGIDAVVFQQFDAWTATDPAEPFPAGTLQADFDVQFDVQLDGAGLLRPWGRQTFYAVQSIEDGESDGPWLIVGHQERPDLARTSESFNWGALKVIYDDPPEPGPYPFPSTRDLALYNFKTAWEDLDEAGYFTWAVGQDYAFLFPEGSPYEPEGGWTRADEVTAFGNLAAGRGGFDAVTGVAWPPVAEVDCRSLLRLNDWETRPADSPRFPGTSTALFDVEMVWLMDGGYYTKTIQGQQLFHLANDPYTINGVTHDRWRVVGQTDLTRDFKANEDVSWGAAKACYLLSGQPAR